MFLESILIAYTANSLVVPPVRQQDRLKLVDRTLEPEFVNILDICWNMSLRLDWSLTTIPQVSTPPYGNASASVVISKLDGNQCCSETPGTQIDFQAGPCDAAGQPIEAHAAASAACLLCLPYDPADPSPDGDPFEVTADVVLNCFSGYNEISTVSAVRRGQLFDIDCLFLSECIILELGSASASGHVEYDLPAPLVSSLDIEILVEVDVDSWITDYEECPGGGLPSNNLDNGTFTSLGILAYDNTGNLLSSSASQGYIESSGGGASVVRGGIFANNGFQETPTTNGINFAGATTVSVVVPAGTKSFEVRTEYYDYSQRDGDIGRVGHLCWKARDAMRVAWNTSLGTTGFDPRVDLNYDNSVDASDLAILNSMGCSADYNCSGGLDFGDTQRFLAAYAAQTVDSDLNYDNQWDFMMFRYS